MTDLSKISMDDLWASDGDFTEPDTSKIESGWEVEAPAYQYFNWWQRRVDNNLAYLFQKGVAQWDSTIEYTAEQSVVLYDKVLYVCKTTNTGNTPSSSSSYWDIIFSTTFAPIDSPTFTGTPASVTPSQFDNSTSIATTAFVKGELGNLSGATSVSSSTSLSFASYAGKVVLVSASGLTITLPDLSSETVSGKGFWIATVYDVTINSYSSGQTMFPLGLTTFTLKAGESVYLANVTSAGWRVLGNIIAQGSHAPLASPTFTGTPLAPTATAGTATTQIATTAFVDTSFAKLASPTFTGSPASTTPSQFDNDTSIATTAFVQTALGNYRSVSTIASSTSLTFATHAGIVLRVTAASVTLTLPDLSSETTLGGKTITVVALYDTVINPYISSQAMYPGALTTLTLKAGESASFTQYSGGLWYIIGNPTGLGVAAPLASPTFTGTPLAPTATAGTATTQIATTAFVDTSFAKLASPTFTGNVYAPTASQFDNDTTVATTAFVQTALGNYRNMSSITTSTSLTFAGHGGMLLRVTAASVTLTLPDLSSETTISGKTITVVALYDTVINPYTSSQVMYPGTLTTLTLKAGEFAAFTQHAGGYWYVTGNPIGLGVHAPLASPTLTGTPASVTPSQFDNDTSIATTAFVQRALGSLSNTTYTLIANTTLTFASHAGNSIYTGTSGLTFTLPSTSSTYNGVAFHIVAEYGCSIVSQNGNFEPTGSATLSLAANESVTVVSHGTSWMVYGNIIANGSHAPLASPTFTGTPLAPTATAGTATTQIATTAFVDTSFAKLASPTFTGSPASVTPSQFDNDTSIATTAFVQRALGSLSTTNILLTTSTSLTLATHAGNSIYVTGSGVTLTLPSISGTYNGVSFHIVSLYDCSIVSQNSTFVPLGSTTLSLKAYEGVTVVCHDTSWMIYGNPIASGIHAPLASPTFTGTPLTTTASLGTNTTQIASTAFVLANSSKAAGYLGYSVSTTLTVANLGKLIAATTSGITLTLPTVSSMSGYTGYGYYIANQTSGTVTISVGSGDTYNIEPYGTTSITLRPYESAQFIHNGLSWNAIGGVFSVSQALSSGTSGYCKLNNGFIIQWGTGTSVSVSATSGSTQTITFPTTFPTSCFAVMGNNTSSSSAGFINCTSQSTSTCVLSYRNPSSSSATIVGQYIAIGY